MTDRDTRTESAASSMKLVPVEMTPEMLEAFYHSDLFVGEITDKAVRYAFKCAVEAAPTPLSANALTGETPRTDALIRSSKEAVDKENDERRLLELATYFSGLWREHARQLERELAEANLWDVRGWWKAVQENGAPILHEDGWMLSARSSSPNTEALDELINELLAEAGGTDMACSSAEVKATNMAIADLRFKIHAMAARSTRSTSEDNRRLLDDEITRHRETGALLIETQSELAGLKAHNWECRLDGKHGSQEVWECQCGDKVYGDPHRCRAPRSAIGTTGK